MGTKRRYSKLTGRSILDIAMETALKENQNLRDLNHLNVIFNKFPDQIISIHIKSVSNSQQAIIRFHNDYGVSISPLSPSNGKKYFELLVLKFYGSGFDDFKIAQYATVPEINWVLTDEDILKVCRQVYLLQRREAGSFSPKIAV